MNHKPLNLKIEDHIETRFSGYHARFPIDPDTTARLNRITKSEPYAKPGFRDRHPVLSLVLHGILFFFIAGVGLIAAVIIREAILF